MPTAFALFLWIIVPNGAGSPTAYTPMGVPGGLFTTEADCKAAGEANVALPHSQFPGWPAKFVCNKGALRGDGY